MNKESNALYFYYISKMIKPKHKKNPCSTGNTKFTLKGLKPLYFTRNLISNSEGVFLLLNVETTTTTYYKVESKLYKSRQKFVYTCTNKMYMYILLYILKKS